jgi:hypothetical protein
MIPSNVHCIRYSHTFYKNNTYHKQNPWSSSTLKMEAVCSSKTLVNYNHTRWHYILGNGTLHSHCCDNLKCCRTLQHTISFKTCHEFGAFIMTTGLPTSGWDSKTLANLTLKYLKAIMYCLCSCLQTLIAVVLSLENHIPHMCITHKLPASE